MNSILAELREELKASADPQTQKTFQRFFKEEVKYYGVKVPTVGKIAKKYWKQVCAFDKQRFLAYARSFTVQTTLRKLSLFPFGCQIT